MPNAGIFTFLGDCLEDEFHVLLTDDAAPLDGNSVRTLVLTEHHSKKRPYEADAFAANFVTRAVSYSAIHDKGLVRLLPTGDWGDVAPPETRYRYALSRGKAAKNAETLMLVVYEVSTLDPDRREWQQKKLAQGALAEVMRWVEREKAKVPMAPVPRARIRTTPIGSPQHVGR